MEPDQHFGILICDDMMWTSRITGTAQDLGGEMKVARDMGRFTEVVIEGRPRCVIFDLDNESLQIESAIELVISRYGPEVRFIAFGSHVDVESLEAARRAGCDPVLPRSRFAQELPELLKLWLHGG